MPIYLLFILEAKFLLNMQVKVGEEDYLKNKLYILYLSFYTFIPYLKK